MKKIKSAGLLAGLAFLVLSCNSDDPMTQTDGPVPMTVKAEIHEAVTKIDDAGTAFTNGDRIGIIPLKDGQVEATQANKLYTHNGTKFQSTAPYYYQDLKEVTFNAYYPYQETLTDNKIALKTDATHQTAEARKANDLLFATAKGDVDKPEVAYTFEHQLTQLTLTFKAGDGVGDLTTLRGYELTTPLVQQGSFDLATGTLEPGNTKSTLAMSLTGATGKELTADPLLLLPQAVTGNELELQLSYNENTYHATLKLTDGLQRGTHYTYEVTINNSGLAVGNASIAGWDTEHQDVEAEMAGFAYDANTNTYTVYTAEGLMHWATAVQTHPATNCTLAADIDMTSKTWVSVCTEIDYTGTFDGAGHTISNLNITTPADETGLIGAVGADGTVKNLMIKGINAYSSQRTGGITGANLGTISCCGVTGGTLGAYAFAGGIAGTHNEPGIIIACYFDGTVSSKFSDGIAVLGDGTVTECYQASDNIDWQTTVDKMNAALGADAPYLWHTDDPNTPPVIVPNGNQ